ncbi:hypothetical protein LTR56_006956 [Elasticomyces elasticus]|nr:hypothetical protein LTR22_021528 [Elasticomyces elasticus]KAK3649480.1 hypothetical protein LTR56_006956 [Elasticomyces elasticus]KAK4916996.1 hypothetical protein LTR49_015033 [Elasticomyces elasticus]KAK5748991.1 hypothetical protein LTS12_020956 [Elasticomyces elasticus]
MYHPHHFQPSRHLPASRRSTIFDATFQLYKDVKARLSTLDNTGTEQTMTVAIEAWIDLALLTERIDEVESEGIVREVKLRRFREAVIGMHGNIRIAEEAFWDRLEAIEASAS